RLYSSSLLAGLVSPPARTGEKRTRALAEWETWRPYLATVGRECQLWKSAPDAAFESPRQAEAARMARKKPLSSPRKAWKVALRPKNSLHSKLLCGLRLGNRDRR